MNIYLRRKWSLVELANWACIFKIAEVVADDTRAIDAVVNADKKRLALLAEKDKLEREAENEGVDNTDRLKEV